MVRDSLSSPHRRSQNPVFTSSFGKQSSSRDELGSWSALFERHRFLLTMLMLLAFLCTIYLYFAVTLGGSDSCSGLSGAEKALCLAKSFHKVIQSYMRKLSDINNAAFLSMFDCLSNLQGYTSNSKTS
ncbi:hypothetical protein J5N97_008206 [Dioscorea zingiberensis]|uniref:Uncharacterized protein n=1 Tax=Dioscorea zingiberensis TaxID=325984 RepID=A0A9D5HUD2_9LILI|nr:hypothetical protein J5N97_008206 [Dioscorea zingiberensis]